MKKTYIYLDDERPNPDPNRWKLFKTSSELIVFLETLGQDLSQVIMSLDHDLGERNDQGGYTGGTGYEVCLWLEEQVITKPEFQMPVVRIHSANPVGRARMQACLDSIFKRKDVHSD